MGILDVIGPVMVGPSSSHTAGACRIGLFARRVLGQWINHADITLHGSFAATGEGHGTPLALLAGLMGWQPEDTRIPRAMEKAMEHDLEHRFLVADLGNVHPNSAKIILKSEKDSIAVCASSVGGGRIHVWEIDGFAVDVDAERPTLLLSFPDRRGIIADISSIISEAQISIASMKVHRSNLDGQAMMTVELDQVPPSGIIDSINDLTHIDMARLVTSVF